MLELIQRTRWDQAYDFLASGDPPMIAKLLALNTIFFILVIIRRAKGVKPLSQSGVIQVQGFLLLANFLLLFQSNIQHLIARFI